jgi:hypothetical protein
MKRSRWSVGLVAAALGFAPFIAISSPVSAASWSSWSQRSGPVLKALAHAESLAIGALKVGNHSGCLSSFSKMGTASRKLALLDNSADPVLNHDIRVYASRGMNLATIGHSFCLLPLVKSNQRKIRSAWGEFDGVKKVLTDRIGLEPTED